MRLLRILLIGAFFFNSSFAEVKKIKISSNEEIENSIASMSLKDKVGQVFISLIYGEKIEKEAKEFLEKTHVGNVLYFSWSNKLSSFSQVKNLSSEIKSHILAITGILPIIAVDQEGGKVSRLKQSFNSLESFSVFPSNREVAQKEPSFAYQIGKTMGKEMKMAGLNLNFAPVVDICLDGNSFLAPRSYGKDPKAVLIYGKEMIKGLHDGGVLSTIKHFPGYGAAGVNPHLALPVVDKSLDDAMKTDLLPFMLLKDETDCIMTAHIIFKALDDVPATLSHKILTDLLRNKLKFTGVVISDSLAMRGVALEQKNFDEAVTSVSKSAVKAFLAGCDLLIISKLEWADFQTSQEEDYAMIEKVLDNFKMAVEKGEIPIKKLNESLERILKLKAKILKLQS